MRQASNTKYRYMGRRVECSLNNNRISQSVTRNGVFELLRDASCPPNTSAPATRATRACVKKRCVIAGDFFL